MRVAILWIVLALGSVAAMAQPADPRAWTGDDFMRAPLKMRVDWLLTVVEVWAPKLDRVRRGVVAVRIGACLEEMMTPRKRNERLAVAAFRASPLGELASLCALHIPEIFESRGD